MKLYKKIFYKIHIIFKRKITFSNLINIVFLLIALFALLVSIKTLEQADKQFKLNSRSSDSLFNVQLRYSKQLNDSLISQISELQEITSKQLIITDEQLKISKETLNDQIYSGRPKILFCLPDCSINYLHE